MVADAAVLWKDGSINTCNASCGKTPINGKAASHVCGWEGLAIGKEALFSQVEIVDREAFSEDATVNALIEI